MPPRKRKTSLPDRVFAAPASSSLTRDASFKPSDLAEGAPGNKNAKGDAVPAASPHVLHIGPAGWSYPDWAGFVYPSRRPRGFHEAAYLSEFFDAIEINTSFYQPLKPENAKQ